MANDDKNKPPSFDALLVRLLGQTARNDLFHNRTTKQFEELFRRIMRPKKGAGRRARRPKKRARKLARKLAMRNATST